MANNHDYNLPTEGTSDWHVPLNENFNQIDRDVEIRDKGSNKGSYEPKDGAKFLATDTGNVFLGDGSSWNQIGSVSTSAEASTTAAPGQVQNQIDSAAKDGILSAGECPNVVRLTPGVEYSPSSTWVVKPGVVLDCQGALIRTNDDIDIIHVHPNAGVNNPYIDQRGMTGWDSAMIKMDTKFGRYWGSGRPYGLRNVHLNSDAADQSHVNNQIGIHLHDSVNSPNGVTKVFCDGFIRGMNESIRLEASGGSSSWTNANRFNMDIWAFEQAITHRAVSGAAVNGNYFDVTFQPHKGTSQWAWSLGTDASYNTMKARCWEKSRFANGTVWEIRDGGCTNNTWIDHHGGFIQTGEVTSSGGANNSLVRWPDVGTSV